MFCLGMTGYYHKFWMTFSGLVTNLSKKGMTFVWDTDCQKVFEKVKAILSSVLVAPGFEK